MSPDKNSRRGGKQTGDADAERGGQRGGNTVNSTMANLGRDIGDYIRQQRGNAQISLRQLAKLAGVSNPYLSQIERGLRRPSAEILQQIARGLHISAEVLYVQAGILDERAGGPVVDAVLADTELSDRQKQVLLDVYQSFRRENRDGTTTTATQPATTALAARTGEPGGESDVDEPAGRAPEPGIGLGVAHTTTNTATTPNEE